MGASRGTTSKTPNVLRFSKVQSKGKQAAAAAKLPSDTHALQFPGALPLRDVIYAYSHVRKEWCRATVVHCRSANGVARGSSVEHYDYYVHWQGTDRRLDCWVSWDDIRDLSEPPEQVGEVDRDSDNEHAGQAATRRGRMDLEYLRHHEESTKLKTIQRVAIGDSIVDTWYFSPYPEEYQNIDILYICEFCLNFFRWEHELKRHAKFCSAKHPPGNEIYRDEDVGISMWEVDGAGGRIFAENLCFLTKLFLDHKTLRHTVALFLFYVMAEMTTTGYRIVGYFSKEKFSLNNLSCICTFPQHQRKGYGKFLIDFSYVLSKLERKRGTPERPLSDLGKRSYVAYWHSAVVPLLQSKGALNRGAEQETTTLTELASLTSIEPVDILMMFEEKDMLAWQKHGGEPYIMCPTDWAPKPPHITVDMNKVVWQSFDEYFKFDETVKA